MLSISVSCVRLQIMKVKALSVTSAGGRSNNTVSWKLWAVKKRLLNVNDTVQSWKPLKMARRDFVLSKPSAALWYLPFLHPLSSLSVMFCCYVAVLVLYGKETVENIILLAAVAISSLWDFNPRRVSPVVKAGHFCSFPWAVAGEWMSKADGGENLETWLVNVTSSADLSRSR